MDDIKLLQGYIREFDAKSAGISVLYAEGFMTEEKYHELMNMEKEKRIVHTGLFIREFKLQEEKEKALNKYVEIFKKENEIKEHQIISRASDALWLINVNRITKTTFGTVMFREDRTASTLLIWKQFNFYYDSWSGEFYIRGYRQNNIFTKKMKDFLIMLENNTSQVVIYKFLHSMLLDAHHGIYEDFVSKKNSIEFIESLVEYFIV